MRFKSLKLRSHPHHRLQVTVYLRLHRPHPHRQNHHHPHRQNHPLLLRYRPQVLNPQVLNLHRQNHLAQVLNLHRQNHSQAVRTALDFLV